MTKDIELLKELKGRLADKMVIESRRTLVNTNVINKCDEYIGALSNAIKIMEEAERWSKTLEQTLKDESKRCKVPTNIRPYSIGYRVVSKNGNILASKDGASVFSLPSEAKKAIQREFGKDDPNFDIGRRKIEEVAIVNFEKLKKFLEEVE